MRLFILIFIIFLFFPIALFSQEEDEESNLFYMLNINNRFELKRNYLNAEKPDKLSFSENSTGYYFYAGGSLLWFIDDEWDLNLSMNSGIMKISGLYFENGRTETTINDMGASDYARKSLFVDELYIEYDDIFSFSAGKGNRSVATDFVFNDYVFFAGLDINLYEYMKKKLTLGLQYNTIDGYFNSEYKSSPMITADITYKNGKAFRFSLFSTFLYDNDNAFGRIYEPFVEAFLIKKILDSGVDASKICGGDVSQCFYINSSGYMLWGGLDLKGNFGGFHYKMTFIVNNGFMELEPYIIVNDQVVNIYKKKKMGNLVQYLKYGDGNMLDMSQNGSGIQSEGILAKELSGRRLLGYMAFADIGYEFSKIFDISPYFLFMSGENDLEKSGYLNSFISVKSYITLSNIFFNGGLNETASSRNFSMAGVNGKGVISPGIWMRLNLPVKMNLGVMKFFAHAENLNNKRDYGTEIDFLTGYSLFKFMDLSLEVDYFISGDFFKVEPDGIKNPFKLLLGLNLNFENLD